MSEETKPETPDLFALANMVEAAWLQGKISGTDNPGHIIREFVIEKSREIGRLEANIDFLKSTLSTTQYRLDNSSREAISQSNHASALANSLTQANERANHHQAEAEKLRQERDAARAEVNRLQFYDGAFLIAKVGLEAIMEKTTEQLIKDMVGRTFDIIRVGKQYSSDN